MNRPDGTALRRRQRAWMRVALLLIAALALQPAGNARAQCHIQLARLLGAGGVGPARLGHSVSVSGDGNTAVVGAYRDGNFPFPGAAYIFVRSGTTWTQQGPKLVPTGGEAPEGFGWSVSVSGDGNTALVGARFEADPSRFGAAYVFVRSGTTWTQQQRLIATGGGFGGQFGSSVSLNADGTTAVIGASGDGGNIGAAYAFVRSGTIWTQQQRLVATGGAGISDFGWSVSVSGDGNTAVVGAPRDSSNIGAAYFFVRSGGIWFQVGPKLVPTGGVGASSFGTSVSLRADGNTAVVGAPGDNANIGAAYVLAYSGTTWTQQQRLIPTGGAGQFGNSVSISGDGNTTMVGAPNDGNGIGAAYPFVRLGGVWMQQGPRLMPTGGLGAGRFGTPVGISGDGTIAMVGAPGDNGDIGAAYALAINAAITFTQQPTDESVTEGTTATFVVAAISNAPLTYQWRRSGVNLVDGPTGSGSVISGAITPTLAISATTPADNGGAFDCVVSNACGPAPSNPAGLAVMPSCLADFNRNGIVNSQDFFDFLAVFFAGC